MLDRKGKERLAAELSTATGQQKEGTTASQCVRGEQLQMSSTIDNSQSSMEQRTSLKGTGRHGSHHHDATSELASTPRTKTWALEVQEMYEAVRARQCSVRG